MTIGIALLELNRQIAMTTMRPVNIELIIHDHAAGQAVAQELARLAGLFITISTTELEYGGIKIRWPEI